jgi:deoxyribodipyrimidine photolyase-related protein
MNTVTLIFPHQLFADHPAIGDHPVYLIEVDLFFTQFPFHKQKLAFHRASMKAFADRISDQVPSLTYIEATSELSQVEQLLARLAAEGCQGIQCVEVIDDWLQQQLEAACETQGLELTWHPSDGFLTSQDALERYFGGKKSFFHQNFYQQQRKQLNILLDDKGKPSGGKWSFDEDNRKKYPKKKTPPAQPQAQSTEHHEEAIEYVNQHFADHLGRLESDQSDQHFSLCYPITHEAAEGWLDEFLKVRLAEFGDYEDAMVTDQLVLNHSVLTPMLNVGLLTPEEVIRATLAHAEAHDTPINSLEGFIRQVIGWREFIRGLYVHVGRQQRTRNFWDFKRPIPESFYTATTGIQPLDETIRKVLDTGYCHHIERLMVLGNFMLLCEFDPDEVYQWFMELFIDAYDWVMVPNVYGMSQFADGGLMATKPYISSSNYLLKMSDFKRGDWQATWDGLFWRFMHEHRDFFGANPRLGMLLKTWDRMSEEKQQNHLQQAEDFLSSL